MQSEPACSEVPARARTVWRADRLDTRLLQGRLARVHLEALGREVAAFHARSPGVDAAIDPGSLAVRLRVAVAALRATSEALRWTESLEALERDALATLREQEARMATRAAAGRVRVLHGALGLDRIHVDASAQVRLPPPAPEPTTGDVCADLAVLAVAIRAAGRFEFAETLVAAYAREADDYDVYLLLPCYQALAACALAGEALEALPGSAVRLVRAALRAPLAPRRLVVVGGEVASGKTTLAQRLAAATDVPCVSADRARSAVAGGTPPAGAAFASSLTAAAYDEVLGRAAAVLSSGRGAVLEGCFATRAQRAAARALASRHGVPFLFAECRAGAGVLRRRLAERSATDGTGKGSWIAIHDRVHAQWEPADDVPPAEHLVVDTSRDPALSAERTLRVIQAGSRHKPTKARPRNPLGAYATYR